MRSSVTIRMQLLQPPCRNAWPVAAIVVPPDSVVAGLLVELDGLILSDARGERRVLGSQLALAMATLRTACGRILTDGGHHEKARPTLGIDNRIGSRFGGCGEACGFTGRGLQRYDDSPGCRSS